VTAWLLQQDRGSEAGIREEEGRTGSDGRK